MKKLISVIAISFCLLQISPAFALNRSELREQIRYFVQDNNSDRYRWTDACLNQRLEIAQLDIVRRTRCLQGTTYYNTVVGISTVTLPYDLMVIERVAYFVNNTTDAYKKIDRFTLFGLDNENQYWMNLGNGLPLKYYVWGSELGLVPSPSSAYYGTKYLQVDYTIIPSTMTADTSVPFNGRYQLYPYHDALIWYVVFLCKLDLKEYDVAKYFEQKYYTALKIMVNEINNKPDWFPDFIIK